MEKNNKSDVTLKQALTASYFETGTRRLATPIKLQNPTLLGLEVPASTQWSNTSRFRHWHPSFGDKGYPPFKNTTQN